MDVAQRTVSQRAAGPEPLSAAEFARADRVARRLHDELRALVGELPTDAQSASGMARRLDIDRTTCQRLASAIRERYSDPALLAKLPGTKGLTLVIEQSREYAPAAVIESVTSAVKAFEALLSEAGSQSKLAKRLDATSREGVASIPPDDNDAASREMLMQAAAALTGRHSDAWVAAYLYQRHPEDEKRLVVPRAHGLIGHRASPGAVPLVFHNFSGGSKPEGSVTPGVVGADGLPRSPGVLERFSSSPLPLVSTDHPGEFMAQMLDPTEQESVDMMFAATGEIQHPATTDEGFEELWALINFPVRWLLLDAYLHRDDARTSIPSLDVHLWRPDFAQTTGRRWQTRFGSGPNIQLLGRGIGSSRSPAYARQRELTEELFERSGADPQEYVGYRVEVPFPIWRAGYCLTFDFSG